MTNPIIDSNSGRVIKPQPINTPITGLSFDLKAMIQSPFFWMVVGGATVWWLQRKVTKN